MSKENKSLSMPKITKAKKDLIVQASVLNPRKRIIANHAGVSVQTLYNWEQYYEEVVIEKLNNEEKLDPKEKLLHEMYTEIDKARADIVKQIQNCYMKDIKMGDWKAAESFLKLFWNELFGKEDEVSEDQVGVIAVPVLAQNVDFMTLASKQQTELMKGIENEKNGG
jgi:hypothetical protein